MSQSPVRSPWTVVGASAVGLFMHFGSLLVNSFGVFLTTIAAAFEWSRSEVSLAFGLATIAALLTMPPTGWLTDRIGARRPILFCTLVFGALFASLALLTPHVWHFYAIFILLGVVGPGTSAVAHASLIARWFTARRGLALGIIMSGTALGGVVWPSVTQLLLDRFGWRNAYALLGAAVLLIAVPLMFFFLKDAPTPVSATDSPQPAASVTGLSRREALRSGVLWLVMVSFFIASAAIHAVMIHLVPMLTDRGMSATSAAFAASLFGVAGMAGRLGTGILLDSITPEHVPTLAFVVVAGGILMLFAGVTGPVAYLAAMLVGFGYGCESATVPYLVSRYFGLRSFSEIYSYLFITVPLGGALGPVLMGAGFDRTGSYRTVLLFWGIATLVVALLMLRLRSHQPFEARTTAA